MGMFEYEKELELKGDKLKRSILIWNDTHPVDFWWRKKYNVPFGSLEHRSMSLVSMWMEWQEDKLLKEYQEREEQAQEDYENELVGLGPTKKEVKMSKSEIDKAFDEIDLADYMDPVISKEDNSFE